ncbi:multidrug efflux SMR transporter [Paenibacillus sp. NEAU-GSW1]|uniref:DMT family transporter n=1 Tax=Paenibacillus sp. NEAU-GSW1 TaxID=2682486 RepID=UPI0012E16611|nr:multidrug efflux SMR transporter [Paenibacillus sp. NEAU-GSW1]MUT65118.1 ligand-binding protein SH3 [Paenibacillus sp. NEAU-GSW1]
MGWIYLILAGLLEVGWTLGLKHSNGFTELVPSIITAVLIFLSFLLFARVIQTIEIGTAYAIFTGLGTVGTVIAGIAAGESADWKKLLFLTVLVVGIIGLKLVSNDKPQEDKGKELA